MAITYMEVKGKTVICKDEGKTVICKDGICMAFTKEQLKEMVEVLTDIEAGTKKFYKEDARRN